MPKSITEIKRLLDARVGQEVLVTVQVGRKRVNQVRGTLAQTYPAIFVVHLGDEEDSLQRVSYSYADLLTKNVALEFE